MPRKIMYDLNHDKECLKKALLHCPILRMGKLLSNEILLSNGELIPGNKCIGCGICITKCSHNAIKLIDF
jgi:translation initiation factor RLI1